MRSIEVMCFGGGVDSTAMLAAHLHRDAASTFFGVSLNDLEAALPLFDAIIFADTGAEMPHTYTNVEASRQLLQQRSNIPFITAQHATHTLPSWLEKNGNLPLLPGGPHVCSLKFKGQVMERAVRQEFGADIQVNWSIGIEANESSRSKRFTKPKDTSFTYAYPLMKLNIDRDKADGFIKHVGWPVEVAKSSCYFCPFMTEKEILDLQLRYPHLWEECQQIEERFVAASEAKHKTWLKAGKPVIQLKTGNTRAPVGMWKKDSYQEGGRLFAKSINGRRLSIPEWTERMKPFHATKNVA